MGDDEYLKIFGPLSFKAAEKFFKFTSWAIIISVISYAKETTGSTVLEWMYVVSIIVFTLALMIQSMYIAVRDPEDWKIPLHLRLPSRVIQVVFGFALFALIGSPYLVLDTLIADLVNAKPHTVVTRP